MNRKPLQWLDMTWEGPWNYQRKNMELKCWVSGNLTLYELIESGDQYSDHLLNPIKKVRYNLCWNGKRIAFEETNNYFRLVRGADALLVEARLLDFI